MSSIKCICGLIDLPAPDAACAQRALEKFCLTNPFTERSMRLDCRCAGRVEARGFRANVMIVNEWSKLEQLFPMQSEIPLEYRLPGPLHQRSILVDGELRDWNGPYQTVLSPIWTRDRDGVLTPTEIGSHPKGSPEATEAALAAAVAAYANGGGRWPTMTVADRIACMEDFTRQMLMRRTEIVRLIMWEVGKTLPDSEKEFDRTIAYIVATIDALKELDNNNSRFVVVEATIGQIRRTPLGVVLCMGPYISRNY
jgi:aldehyde dehydrogenase (NAD+)